MVSLRKETQKGIKKRCNFTINGGPQTRRLPRISYTTKKKVFDRKKKKMREARKKDQGQTCTTF